jgi:hypothetical protein
MEQEHRNTVIPRQKITAQVSDLALWDDSKQDSDPPVEQDPGPPTEQALGPQLTFNTRMFDALLELCPPKRLPMVTLLYLFYKEVSSNQGTNQIRITDAECMEGLHWTKHWHDPAKRFLKKVGLIEVIHKKRTKNDKYSTYIKIYKNISLKRGGTQ